MAGDLWHRTRYTYTPAQCLKSHAPEIYVIAEHRGGYCEHKRYGNGA